MKNAHYDNQPSKYQAMGDGSYKYRWAIEEVVATDDVAAHWKCLEVVVWGTVTRKLLTQEVIEALWGKGVEEKLLNDYNAAQLEILDESYIQIYKDFLNERKDIKEMINADCIDLQIF